MRMSMTARKGSIFGNYHGGCRSCAAEPACEDTCCVTCCKLRPALWLAESPARSLVGF